MTLKALALNGTLKTGSSPASTDRMIATLAPAFAKHDVDITETIRLADYNIPIFARPIWMGQVSSVSIPAVAARYGMGEATGSKDYEDLDATPRIWRVC